MQIKKPTLADIADSLSDDFQGTFTVANLASRGEVLINLCLPTEIDDVVRMIKERIPGAVVGVEHELPMYGRKFVYYFYLKADDE